MLVGIFSNFGGSQTSHFPPPSDLYVSYASRLPALASYLAYRHEIGIDLRSHLNIFKHYTFQSAICLIIIPKYVF